ncbi:MAG: SBBP repeat-containing protein [Bdellovibrionales bacterium]|nr:SBBP repeat-containing protein [Bdellovibrionales bacterium]
MVDGSGNVYCAGYTDGALSEANGTNGGSDAFVMKLDSSGVIQWVTQLGAVTKAPGAPGDANQGGDFCNGVSVDATGNVYCAGYTDGALSEANGGSGDAFVMKLDSSGTVQWVTQLGAVTKAPGAPGDANQGGDFCKGVSTDTLGNVYCAGNTDGALSEANGGRNDAFVMKLDSSGVIQWVTQLGAVTKAPGAPGDANQENDFCNGVSTDTLGNVYCAGNTDGALSEANGTNGGSDAFVMKLDSSGTVQWVTQLGAVTKAPGAPGDANQDSDFCNGVSVDATGNVYCAGFTKAALSEASGGDYDAFVMKLDSSGTVQWVTQLGAVTKAPGAPGDANQGEDVCNGVSVDATGNVYCAGYTDGALSEVNGGSYDAFVMKLNSSGVIQWVAQLGAVTTAPGAPRDANRRDDFCNGVSVDATGNVYCAGHTGGVLSEVNAGVRDAVVMKLNSNGAIQWVTQLGAVTKVPGVPAVYNRNDERCQSVSTDTLGNVYCAGYTDGTLTEANGGGKDAFVMKIDSSGTVQWVTQLGAVTKAPGAPGDANQGDDVCKGVSVDATGNVYCAGYTSGALSETNGGNYDAFVMKLNSSGVIQWVTQLGAVTMAPNAPVGANVGNDYCNGVSVDATGNVYCAGHTFGILSEAIGGRWNSDVFVMKLDSNGAIQWVTQLGAVTKAPGAPAGANAFSEVCNGVSVDATGNVYCAGQTSAKLSENSGGSYDAFVMKLDSSGVVQWLTQLGAVTKAPGAPVNANQGFDFCNGVSVDALGNVYCAGYTTGALSEANGAGGTSDAFVMKLNSSGVIQWVTQLGAVTMTPNAPVGANVGNDYCNGVSVDALGNVYCAGYTDGALSEANGAGGASDAFVMKLDSSGVVQWLTQLGAVTKAPGAPVNANQDFDFCNGVSVDATGNVYCAGHTGGVLSEANGGYYDAFILKLKPDGKF